MPCYDIEELREHLCCEIELDEYDDGHFTVECITCNKILLHVYPLILPAQIISKIRKKESFNGKFCKNYHIL